MLIPALSFLLLKLACKETVYLGIKNFQWSWLLLAVFIFPTVIHLVCIPVLYFLTNGNIPWNYGMLPDSVGQRVLTLLLNAALGLIISSAFVFFEEVGWRAWMQSKLQGQLNVRKSILITSVIWALWHIPFVLGGIHHIDGIDSYWLLITNPLGHIGAGIVIGWIWLNTQSIWLVTLAHASLNNWGQFAFKYIEDDSSLSLPLLFGLNSSVFIVGLIILIRKIPNSG